MSDSIVRTLIESSGSTTYLLESIKGEPLNVLIVDQVEEKSADTKRIVRKVKLYFNSFDYSLLYCVSYLNKISLTPDEYNLLTNDSIPIGVVFGSLNDKGTIKKRNIVTYETEDTSASKMLNVVNTKLFLKKYDYWVGDRFIGTIHEFFNEESLARL